MQQHTEPQANEEACRRFEAALAAYLEGEDESEVGAHVHECPFCYSVLADLEQIRSASRELGWEEPPATLWASVRATLVVEGVIHQPRSLWERLFSGTGLRAAAIPAALACLVLVAAVLIRTPGDLGSRRAALASRVVEAMPQETQVADVLSEMESAYRARAGSFDPQVRATYTRGLESLDEEIRECQRSVREEPGNTLARDYLVSAYTQKAHLLETALEYEGR